MGWLYYVKRTKCFWRMRFCYRLNLWQYFILYMKVFTLCELICICSVDEVYNWSVDFNPLDLHLFTLNTTFPVYLVFLFRMHKYIFCNAKIVWQMLFLALVGCGFRAENGIFFFYCKNSYSSMVTILMTLQQQQWNFLEFYYTRFDKLVQTRAWVGPICSNLSPYSHVVRRGRALPERAELWRRAAAVATLVGV